MSVGREQFFSEKENTNREGFFSTEEGIRSIFDNAQELIVVLQDGKVKFVNNLAKIRGGYSEEKIDDLDFIEFIHPEDRKDAIERYMQRMAGKEVPGIFRLRLKKNDGKYVWTSLKAVNINWNGQLATLNFISDISDTVETENEIIRIQKFHKLVVENALEAIVIIQDQRPAVYNESIPHLLGYSNKEFEELNFLELIHPDHREKVIDRYISRINGIKVPNRDQYMFLKKDGTIIWGDVNTILIDWKGKKATLNFIEDISERVKASKSIQVEKAQSEFYLDLLGHDIRNLIHGISMWMELGRRMPNLDEKLHYYLDQSCYLTERSKRLIRNVLMLSKIRDQTPKMDRIELLPILEYTLVEAKRFFPEMKIISEMRFDGCDPVVMAEPIIEEVFINVVHNGIKVQTTDEPHLLIECELCSKDKVRISISDWGPGIPEKFRETTFQRINDFSGNKLTGIGLALTKELVDRYNGSIYIVDNIQNGEICGAKFVIEFPTAQ